MAKSKAPQPLSAIPLAMAKLSLYSGIAWLVLLALLHIIKSGDVDPSWETVSYYAVGSNGWLMVVASMLAAVSYGALFLALKSQIKTVVGRIGLALLLLAALGTVIGGLFLPDPIQVRPEDFSQSGNLHGMGAGAALMFIPLAALIININLIRKNEGWKPAKRALALAAGLPLLGVVVFMIAQSVMLPNGGGNFGPDVKIGWPDRFGVLAYGAWQLIVAWQAVKLRKGA